MRRRPLRSTQGGPGVARRWKGGWGGFTLIELLVVIAIIALLAGLIMGVFPRAAAAKKRERVKVELAGLVTVIEAYYHGQGFYPPDNPGNPGQAALFYELTGTVSDGTQFETYDGERIRAAEVKSVFGVDGFINTGGTRSEVKNFYPSIPPSQAKPIPSNSADSPRLLVVPVEGPDGEYNPWRYDASSPGRHNAEGFDLWAEVLIRGNTNVIGNWKE